MPHFSPKSKDFLPQKRQIFFEEEENSNKLGI